MTAQDPKHKISAYLARFIRAHELAEDDDIFRLGFVSSLFAMQLVNFLEHEFAIEIENEDMELDNFRSIRALARLVERKSSTRAAS